MALQNNRSMTEVLQDIVGDVQELVRSEFRLAKAEIREELTKATKSSGLLAAGVVLAVYAGGFLLLTAVNGLETILAHGLRPCCHFGGNEHCNPYARFSEESG